MVMEIKTFAMQAIGEYKESETSSALKQRDFKDATDLVAYSFDSISSNSMKSSNPNSGCRMVEIAKCLDTTDPNPCKNQGGIAIVHTFGVDCRNAAVNEEMCATLQAKSNGGFSHNCIHPVIIRKPPKYIVRRLTPTECARLQGFPDNWGVPDKLTDFTREQVDFWQEVFDTHAEINGKKKHQYSIGRLLQKYNALHTDSAEYKMWGNGIALPNALYVMQGIADVLMEEQDG